MALSDPDLTFANQVDAYISDDDDSTLPSHSQQLVANPTPSPPPSRPPRPPLPGASPSNNFISTAPSSAPAPIKNLLFDNSSSSSSINNNNNNNNSYINDNDNDNTILPSTSSGLANNAKLAHLIQKPAANSITTSHPSLLQSRPSLTTSATSNHHHHHQEKQLQEQEQQQQQQQQQNLRDSLQITRQRLSRFHHDAKSFITANLSTSYPNNLANNSSSNNNTLAPSPFETHPSATHNNGINNQSGSSRSPRFTLDSDRLARFHAQAVSFLDRAYANPNPASSAPALLGEEKQSCSSSNSFSLASSGIYAAAGEVSGTGALPIPFDSRQSAAQSRLQNRRMLEQFHTEALHFLDTAAAASLSIDPHHHHHPSGSSPRAHDNSEHRNNRFFEHYRGSGSSNNSGGGIGFGRPPASAPPPKYHELDDQLGNSTSIRIARDKARLEQHYRDAMSFLDRPDNDRRMIEEQELESATVERFQLQKYAREAMSFLDKAFRGDASVMVNDDDDEDRNSSSAHPSPESAARTTGANTAPGRHALFVDSTSQAASASATGSGTGAGIVKQLSAAFDQNAGAGSVSSTARTKDNDGPPHADEAGQIAADRAALERYDQEFGHFLSKAYEDDATVIVDDADSDASGAERQLYARRMAPASSSSADTGYSDSMTNDEQLSEDAFTDDEFQSGPLAGAEEMAPLQRSFPTITASTSGAPSPFIAKQSPSAQHEERESILDNAIRMQPISPSPSPSPPPDDSQDSEAVRSRMARYELEAADYLDGANVTDDEEDVILDNANAIASPPVPTDGHTPSASPPGDFQLDALSTIPFERDRENDILAGRRMRRAQRPPSMDDSRLMRAHQRGAGPGGRSPELSHFVESHSTTSSEDDDDEMGGLAFGHRDTLQRGSTPPARFFAPPSRLPDRKADGSIGSPPEIDDATKATPLTTVDNSREPSVRDASSSGSPLSGRNDDGTGNVKMDVTLEHGSDRKQYREMPIERSFYRQIPRGATIKLRPRMSPPLSNSSRTTGTSAGGSDPVSAPGLGVPLDDLRRVEKERDVLMATLEEIVNERSQLAAQVSEMKSMIRAVGDKGDSGSPSAGGDLKDGVDAQEHDIDIAAELREAHAIMEKMTEEMDETLSVLDGRYQDTLQRAHAAEEKCIRLEANASRQDSQFSAQGARLTAALAEERRLSGLLARTEKELEELRLKSDGDIQRLQDEFREEGERKLARIRELTSEVSVLHDRLRDAATSEERQAMLTGSKRLELEVSSLRDTVADLEAQMTRERESARRKREQERETLQREADDKIDRLTGQLRVAQRAVQEAEALRGELEIERAERGRATTRADKAELGKAEVEGQVVAARRAQKAAEIETSEIRTRFEESMKQRISQMDQTGELVELQESLQALRDGAAEREGNLQRQLEEFKTRAEQAEQAATAAERGAKEAAEMARLAQERSRAAVETERQARQEAESDREAISAEWEKFSKQQQEKMRKEEVLVAKSSSRRGLRKSPSKNIKDEKRRKKRDKEKSNEDGKGAGSEETSRKKSSHRPRLFG